MPIKYIILSEKIKKKRKQLKSIIDATVLVDMPWISSCINS